MSSVQLNLLPDIKKEFVQAQKTRAMVVSLSIVVTLVAIGLSVLLFIYVTFVQQLQVAIVSGDIKNKEKQLSGVTDLSKYLTIQNQLSALPDLHTSKGLYSRLFDFLPVLNPNDPNSVSLSQLQASNTENSITFTGTTATFESLNVFVDTLRNATVSYKDASGQPQTSKIFSAVAVQNSAIGKDKGQSNVGFTINTTYNTAVFDAHNTNVSASVPNIQTTQSVTQSPKVFGGGQ